MARYLAVAHQTSEAPEFIEAILAVARKDPAAEVVLLVPATPVSHLATWSEGEATEVAAQKAGTARSRLEKAGVNIVEARVGDHRPLYAIKDMLDEQNFDGIIVATFPPGVSRWLAADLVRRLERSTDLPVTHVVAH